MQAIVVIMDSSEPGTLAFKAPSRSVAATGEFANIPVIRKNGADGRVSVRFRTEDADAVAGAPSVILLLLCKRNTDLRTDVKKQCESQH